MKDGSIEGASQQMWGFAPRLSALFFYFLLPLVVNNTLKGNWYHWLILGLLHWAWFPPIKWIKPLSETVKTEKAECDIPLESVMRTFKKRLLVVPLCLILLASSGIPKLQLLALYAVVAQFGSIIYLYFFRNFLWTSQS